MDFVKMHGLGNDFVVTRGPLEPSAEQVAAWCDRRRGVGADGVLVVSSFEDGGIRMEYWNADGGKAGQLLDILGDVYAVVEQFDRVGEA